MKLSLKLSQLISYIAASILGILFHFAYEWSGNNFIIGLFTPINESTWEHLKLVFFPILIISLLEYFVFNIRPSNFVCTKLNSALIAMALTVVLFYTYVGILGTNYGFANIAIYLIAMAVAYIYSYRKLKKESPTGNCSRSCLLDIILIIFLFMFLTVYPLPIGLFESPV